MTETTTHSDKASRRRNNVLIVLILVLLGLNIYFLADNIKLRKTVRTTKQTTETLRTDIARSEHQRHTLILQMDSLDHVLSLQMGLNEELDVLVDSLRTDLAKRKAQYSSQLSKSKNLEKEISALQLELTSAQADYQTQITTLKERLQIVEAENTALKDSVSWKQVQIRGLSKKVEIGQVMNTSSIEVHAVRERASGKEVTTDVAKRTEQFRVCFSFVENRIAPEENKSILLRIVNPIGETMAVEAQGSGVFTLAEVGDQSLYSMRTNVPYTIGSQESHCLYYTPQTELATGKYTMELYHEGYLIGETQLTLKKGGLL